MTVRTIEATRPRRLSGRARKITLMLHIASAGAWFGIDVVMAVVIFRALLTGDDATKAVNYQALELFAIWPSFVMGVSCLTTGVILGLGSKYGLVRYWWVTAKLAINLVLTTLILVALRPGVAEAAEDGRRIDAGQMSQLVVGDIVFPPIVAPTAVLLAMYLSVFKPWGRLRRGTATTR